MENELKRLYNWIEEEINCHEYKDMKKQNLLDAYLIPCEENNSYDSIAIKINTQYMTIIFRDNYYQLIEETGNQTCSVMQNMFVSFKMRLHYYNTIYKDDMWEQEHRLNKLIGRDD